MMEYQQIRYGVADGIATLTLARPANLNAYTVRMMEEMIDAFDLPAIGEGNTPSPRQGNLLKVIK